ncbi:hypothetical protein [Eikenella corrodens]|uniref:hypothetical protein n=1 Tax=Eikenella corrodens TaxID=539 RepID=UPI0012DA3E3C|nr:hypothetical protein [Eikenella corrodens]
MRPSNHGKPASGQAALLQQKIIPPLAEKYGRYPNESRIRFLLHKGGLGATNISMHCACVQA